MRPPLRKEEDTDTGNMQFLHFYYNSATEVNEREVLSHELEESPYIHAIPIYCSSSSLFQGAYCTILLLIQCWTGLCSTLNHQQICWWGKQPNMCQCYKQNCETFRLPLTNNTFHQQKPDNDDNKLQSRHCYFHPRRRGVNGGCRYRTIKNSTICIEWMSRDLFIYF